MGQCEPLTESGWIDLKNSLAEMQSPPAGMRIVTRREHGKSTAFLVDDSVLSFQGDGYYSFMFPHAAEEVRRICKAENGYKICMDQPTPFQDMEISSLDGCITGRVVRRLTICE